MTLYFETYNEPNEKSGPSDHFKVIIAKSSVAKEQSACGSLQPTVITFSL